MLRDARVFQPTILWLLLLSSGSAAAESASGEVPRATDGQELQLFDHEPIDDLVVPDAEGEERSELAQLLADQGRRSLEQNNFETAARQLEVSYRLVGLAELLYPLGQAYTGMGEPRAAAERLEAYLERYEGLSAEDRAEAEALLERNRQHFAEVNLLSQPPGATLHLDGRQLGTAPLDEPLILLRGDYDVRAQLEGYHEAIEALHVDGGAAIERVLRLEPLHRPPPRGLSIGLWSSLGLTAASVIATVTVMVLAVQRLEEVQAADFPTSRMSSRAESTWAAAWALVGVTGAATAATVVFGVLRAGASRATD